MRIGKKILLERRKRYWSQNELSRRCGIGQQHLSKIERGVLYPRHTTLGKITKAFGSTTEEFRSDLDSTLAPKEYIEVAKDIGGAAFGPRPGNKKIKFDAVLGALLYEIKHVKPPQRLAMVQALLTIAREIRKGLTAPG